MHIRRVMATQVSAWLVAQARDCCALYNLAQLALRQ